MRAKTFAADADIDRQWWKEAVVYQIYPKSFYDTDGDGFGDLPGIIEKVDYLDDLGVDVVWLNPVYDSPHADNGYDIADYRSILDQYGTMADWEELRDELHDRGMKLIMDLVVNHTSDEHEWFRKSRREEPGYEDYYHWVEGDPDEPPNGWESFFSGPAWSWDAERGAWYLHLFDEKQPDLNWRNPEVRQEIYDMMTWWLEKDIDGFRMDVVNLISKTADYSGGAEGFMNGPKIHDYLQEMNEEVLSHYDIMTVGEMVGVSADLAREYVGDDGDGLDMLIHFDHMGLDHGIDKWDHEDWDLQDLKHVMGAWQESLADEGWNCLYLNNHDQPRMVSRFGDDGAYREESAKMLATCLHGHQGTPFVFQGEELGMTNVPFEELSEFQDVETINFAEEAFAEGWFDDYGDIRPTLERMSRDNGRTPMQWTDGENAGFTDGDPWIKLNPNHTEVNVEAARADPGSVWHYYQRLIELREGHDVWVYGDFEMLDFDHPTVYAFRRTLGDRQLLFACNFYGNEPEFGLPGHVDYDEADLLLANYEDASPDPDHLHLRPYEARVYELR